MSLPKSAVSIAFAVAGAGIATYAAMDVVMKGLALSVGAYNALLWRSMLTVLFAGAIYLWKKPDPLTKSAVKLHVWRGMVISVMAFLFFWGLKYLPVAEAIGLSFIAPLIALYLAAVVLKEEIGKQAVAASILGLVGAVVVITGRLSGEYSDEVGLGIAAILTSALLYAYNIILQRQQALMAGPTEIAFFQNLTICILFSLLAPWLAVPPSLSLVPQFVSASLLGLVSLLMMSWAYARAPANALIPVEYTAFAWAAVLGWLVFGETVTITTLIGTALIVIGCLIAASQHPEHVDHVETTSL